MFKENSVKIIVYEKTRLYYLTAEKWFLTSGTPK